MSLCRRCRNVLAIALLVFSAGALEPAAASMVPYVTLGDGPGVSTVTEYGYRPLYRGWFVGPVSASYEATAGSWVKELEAPSHGWSRRNGTYNLFEVVQVGSGPAWTGWQEQILTSGWDWVKGSVYAISSSAGVNPGLGAWSPFRGLSLLDAGDVTGGSIKFDFGPVATGTWLLIAKTLEWEGTGRPHGSIQVEEKMSTVPLPAAAWMLGAGLVGLVALRRRVRRS